MGSIMGLLDADDDERILEYYRYTVYGEATVLPIVDDGSGSGTAGDRIEDTPFDLSDNNTLMLAERASIAKFGRVSRFQNTYTYTGRRLDEKTGLHYYRYRYYEARMGRFVGRDPAKSPWSNLYGYVMGMVTSLLDGYGLWPVAGSCESGQADYKGEAVLDADFYELAAKIAQPKLLRIPSPDATCETECESEEEDDDPNILRAGAATVFDIVREVLVNGV